MDFLKKTVHTKKTQNEYNKAASERDKIKQELLSLFVNLGFSENQIGELFRIIDAAQDKIEDLKKELIGSNINKDPRELQNKIFGEIKQVSSQMNMDLKYKTDEIIEKNKRENKI